MNNCCNRCGRPDCCGDCCDPCAQKCCSDPCGCPTQILSIDTVHSDTPYWLRFNFGGKSIDYDFTSVVKSAETDTNVRLDIANRALIYNAERHIDSFSASELGSILHIADIGDVDISGVTDNSLFVYQKNSDCGEGCEGINNSWVAWNSNEHLVDSVETLMGFDSDGKPQTLNHPVDTNQYYQLGWNGADKLSFSQPVEVSTPPVDSDGKVWRLYVDPNTRQLVVVKEDA